MTVPAPDAAEEPDPRALAWRDLADELAPARSLARADTAAARVLTNVSVVGSVVTGLGLLAAGLPTASAAAPAFAVAAVVVAVLAVACALVAQTLTIRKGLNTNNLLLVKAWYRGQFRRRAYPTRAATVLLLVAVLLAGSAAVVGLLASRRPHLSLAVSQTSASSGTADDGRSGADLTVDVTFRAAGTDTGATVTVTATGQDGPTVLARAAMTPGSDGTASRTLTVSDVPDDVVVDVTAVGGQRRCRATWDTAGTAAPAVTCSARGS